MWPHLPFINWLLQSLSWADTNDRSSLLSSGCNLFETSVCRSKHQNLNSALLLRSHVASSPGSSAVNHIKHAHCRPSGRFGAALTTDGKPSVCVCHIHSSIKNEDNWLFNWLHPHLDMNVYRWKVWFIPLNVHYKSCNHSKVYNNVLILWTALMFWVYSSGLTNHLDAFLQKKKAFIWGPASVVV